MNAGKEGQRGMIVRADAHTQSAVLCVSEPVAASLPCGH